MTYHPLTIRALRLYQGAAKARLPRIPDIEADDDYAGAAAFAASEPGARDPIVSLRSYTRKRCAELLAECRKIRSAMRRGTWQGDNGPLDLAAAQESLWHRREDRRAFLAAAARAAVPAPVMVPQQAQQQQGRAWASPKVVASAEPGMRDWRVYLGRRGEFLGTVRATDIAAAQRRADAVFGHRETGASFLRVAEVGGVPL